MRLQELILLFVAVVFSVPALARSTVPIVNHDKVTFSTASGKPIKVEQVKHAFITAGAKRGWTFTPEGDNKLTGTLVVRTHTIVTTITYGSDHYSIAYKGSQNMKYDVKDGAPVIHPFYNKWVQTLINDVNVELSKY